MSLLVDNKMNKYVEPSTGRIVVVMNIADKITIGGREFVRKDKFVEPVKSTVEVKPAPTVKSNK